MTTANNPEVKAERALQLGEHTGKFYFKRAFLTTFAILTAMSAFIAAWMLIWGLTIGGLWGLGQTMEGDPAGQNIRTSQPPARPAPPIPVLSTAELRYATVWS